MLCVLSAVQFLVGAMNLLPIDGLDGGDVLKNILLSTNIKNVGFVCSLVSIITACAVFVLGLAVAVKNVSNPSLLLLGIYLIIVNIYRYV
jgi:Zn-dependent protease